jgi:hypothetical protein
MNRRNRLPRWPSLSLAATIGVLFACAPDAPAEPGASDSDSGSPQAVTLGPADGLDLPPTDLERVALGTTAPDFSLQTLAGDTVTLSSFRGARDVILVFYRGHW